MKTKPNDSIHNSEQGPQDGLTKRECFAGLAMQGLSADNHLDIENAVRIAVELADALIEELNKTKE